ncbi:MAG TPA: hypothetical protein VFN41_08005 [Candidatus Limnocylindrales bacterium]|nr:hypothetical protein [Candidatus Limnocylindrales bacterium]
MQATQQQTLKEPRTALAAVVLAVAFSTGTVLGLAIGVSGPKFGPTVTAAPIGDRSYDAIEETRAASGLLTIAGDRSYDAIEDARTIRGVSAPAGKSFHAPGAHGPLEFD